MVVLQSSAVFLLLVPALVLGALWVRRAWRTADAHACVVLGAVVGLSAHLVVLNALCYLILPRHAAPLLCLAETLVGVVLWLTERKRPRFDFKVCAADLRAVWPWLLPVAAAWIWYDLRQGSSDQSFHAALSMVLAKSGLPNFHPYDTGQTLLYHHGLDLCAASLGACVGLKPWWALNVLVALLAPLALGACVEFLRAAAAREGRSATRAELVLGTLLFALGGNLTWVEALSGRVEWLAPGRYDFACDGIAGLFFQPAAIAAWTWLFGILALALRWPGSSAACGMRTAEPKEGQDPFQTQNSKFKIQNSKFNTASPAIPLGLTLAAVCLLAEQAALAIGVALVFFTLRQLRGSRSSVVEHPREGIRGDVAGPRFQWNAASDLLLAGVLGLGVALVQGGILTGLALQLSGSSVLRPAWTGTWIPAFPTQAGRVAWGDPAYVTVLWREYAHTLVLLPLLLCWCFSRRSPLAVRWLVSATLPGVALALYTRFPLNDFDTYRFYQLYFGAAMLATGLWLARRWLPRSEVQSVPAGAARGGSAGHSWPAWTVALAALLCLQGVRATLAQAINIYPELPYRYHPGQVAALEEVAARGQVHEGILCQIPDLPFSIPPTPGVQGVPVAASDPDTDTQAQRGRAWQRALACPSPANLRTARTRWVCLGGADLARAIPLLEGASNFEFFGAFGDAPRYRLYRYAGTWEEKEHLLWRARTLERHRIHIAQLAGVRLADADLAHLTDGNPGSSTALSRAALAGKEGLMLDLAGGTGGPPSTVSWVWVLALKHRGNFLEWGGLHLELLVEETAERKGTRPSSSEWVAVRGEGVRVLLDSQMPHACGLHFPPIRALAVRLRLPVKPAEVREAVEWAEIHVGKLEE